MRSSLSLFVILALLSPLLLEVEYTQVSIGTKQDLLMASSMIYPGSRGSILYVDGGGGQDHLTIQSAIDSAVDGDTIYVWSGVYLENPVIDRKVNLIGNSSLDTIISGIGHGDVVSMSINGSTIRGFKIRHSGSDASGLQLKDVSDVRVEECIFAYNGYGSILGNNNTVLNSSFLENHYGISILGEGNSIINNTFEMNMEGISIGPTKQKVLLMGNSYTYGNDLDSLVESIFKNSYEDAKGVRLAEGGLTLSEHGNRVRLSGTIWNTTLNGGTRWDYVILQDHSQIPGFLTDNRNWVDSLSGAKKLDPMIERAGAETVFLMTWGRRDGDPSNINRYPNYTAMQSHLEIGYRKYAENVSTEDRPIWIAPVGLAWKHIFEEINQTGSDPTSPGTLFYDLYSSDGSHPSLSGSYLAACVIYATTTGRSPVGSRDTTPLSSDLRSKLQVAAHETVFNENPSYSYPWQFRSDPPTALNNTIMLNTFSENYEFAVRIVGEGSRDNKVVQNDFLDNNKGGVQAKDNGTDNLWDDGSMGNYWRDHPTRYPGASHDGAIWNISYMIAGESGAEDRYPFADPLFYVDDELPIALAGPDQIVDVGSTVMFNGSKSSDNIGIVNYTWEFGYNGTSVNLYGVITNFTFDIVGNYNILLIVRDEAGNQQITAFMMRVDAVAVWDTTPPIPPFGIDLNTEVENNTLVVIHPGNWTDEESFSLDHMWTFYYEGKRQIIASDILSFYFGVHGKYNITLNVTNSEGLFTLYYFEIFVLPDRIPPVAHAGEDIIVDQFTTVRLDGSRSHDNVGFLNFTWRFQDIGPVELFGYAPGYYFENAGLFLIELNLTDDMGNLANDIVTVTVRDITAPVVDIGHNYTIDQGELSYLSGIRCTDNVGIIGYNWTIEGDETFYRSGLWDNFRFHDSGIYRLTLEIWDEAGNNATGWIWVTVLDTEPPVSRINRLYDSIYVGMELVMAGSESSDNVRIVNWTWTLKGTRSDDEGIRYSFIKVRLFGESIRYSFYEPGVYDVNLTVFDAEGNSHETSINIVVLEDELAPPLPTGNGQPEDWRGHEELIMILCMMSIAIIIILVLLFMVRRKFARSGDIIPEE